MLPGGAQPPLKGRLAARSLRRSPSTLNQGFVEQDAHHTALHVWHTCLRPTLALAFRLLHVLWGPTRKGCPSDKAAGEQHAWCPQPHPCTAQGFLLARRKQLNVFRLASSGSALPGELMVSRGNVCGCGELMGKANK